MSITARDRKILAVLIALAVLAGYWFMVLGPKREEATQAAQELTEQEERRDAAVANLAQLESARDSFETDYASVVRLGKAVPTEVDVPSLMIQLEDAAEGAGISFDSITVGERTPIAAAAPGAPAPGTDSTPAEDTQPAAESGGETAQTGAGQAAETAGETADTADAAGAEAAGEPAPTAESAPAAPAGDAATAPATSSGTTAGAPTLEGVSLTFSFRGDFFELADLFHELKRFVALRGERIDVDGRLMTVDNLSLTPSEKGSELTAEVTATAYVAPAAQEMTAGATPAGPDGTAPPTPQAVEQPAHDTGASPPAATSTAPASGATP